MQRILAQYRDICRLLENIRDKYEYSQYINDFIDNISIIPVAKRIKLDYYNNCVSTQGVRVLTQPDCFIGK